MIVLAVFCNAVAVYSDASSLLQRKSDAPWSWIALFLFDSDFGFQCAYREVGEIVLDTLVSRSKFFSVSNELLTEFCLHHMILGFYVMLQVSLTSFYWIDDFEDMAESPLTCYTFCYLIFGRYSSGILERFFFFFSFLSGLKFLCITTIFILRISQVSDRLL